MTTTSPMDAASSGSSFTLASTSANMSMTPPAVPEIQFTTVKRLFDEIDRTVGDILIVHGVSVQQFAEIDKERERRRRRFRFRCFEAAAEKLTITIPTRPHEALHLHLSREVDIAIFQMGLTDSWEPMGGATMFVQAAGPPGGGSGGAGEGDSSGGPLPQRGGTGDWPTLVIEAGYSQTLDDMRRVMRWWFGASNHQVKIVLLAKFDRGARSIILEKWVEGPARTRPGATTTRAAAAPEPTRRQLITIAQVAGVSGANRLNPLSYSVTGGPLRLEFDLLFLRQAGQGEGDIIFSIQELQRYAVGVWRRVN